MKSPEPVSASSASTAIRASAAIADRHVERSEFAPESSRAGVHACPFLIAESGDWRLAMPAREHRCAALVPLAALTFEKQARLCLQAAHETCATYGAALAAREARTGGAVALERAGRWGFALTTPLIQDAGGVRTRVGGILADRRRWPAVPVMILVATLSGLAISGGRTDRPLTTAGSAVAGVTLASPTPRITPTAEPAITAAPATASPASSPTSTPPAATPSPPTATPLPTQPPTPVYRTYRVKYGDTLSGIAARYHTTVLALERLNGITDPTRIRVGTILRIP